MIRKLAAGCGPAGAARFPTVGRVYNAVQAKKRFAADADLGAAYRLLERLRTAMTEDGWQVSVEGRQTPLNTLPLRAAVRRVRALAGEGEGEGERRMRVGEMARLLDLIYPPEHRTIVLGRRRAESASKVELDTAKPRVPGAAYAWVLVQLRGFGVAKDVAEATRSAMGERYLPTLSNIAEAELPAELPRADELAAEIAALNEVWSDGSYDSALVRETRALIMYLACRVGRSLTIRTNLFGSRVYGVCKPTSDIDIVMTVRVPTWNSEAEFVQFCQRLAVAMRKSGRFTKVVWISQARVPIIKFELRHGSGAISGDISFNTGLGLAKSRMLAAYIAMDPRVRPFLVLLKHWGEARWIADPHTLNSFGLSMMGLAFLISRRVVPPLQLTTSAAVDDAAWRRLKALHASPDLIAAAYSRPRCIQTGAPLPDWRVDGHQGYFYNAQNAVFSWRSPNTTSVFGLLFEMFQFYGARFDPIHHAISPRLGSPCIARASLAELQAPMPEVYLSQPQQWANNLRLLAIEDPFERGSNIARNVHAEWVEGLLWEMRRAATCMAQGLYDTSAGVLSRLFVAPSPDVYPDAAVWAPVYRRLLTEVYDLLGEPNGMPAEPAAAATIDLQALEQELAIRAQSAAGSSAAQDPVEGEPAAEDSPEAETVAEDPPEAEPVSEDLPKPAKPAKPAPASDAGDGSAADRSSWPRTTTRLISLARDKAVTKRNKRLGPSTP